MNLFEGKIVSLDQFKKSFSMKNNYVEAPLEAQVLFDALERIKIELVSKSKIYNDLVNELKARGDLTANEIELSMEGLIDFIAIDNLRLKIKREFGSEYPFELKRISMREKNFESWYPLGVLVHVTPSNSALLSVLGLIEGLLSANVNFLKLGRKDTNFAVVFFHRLIELDTSNVLKKYLFIGRVSSKDQSFLKEFLSVADVVSAWGNEESIKSLRELLPHSTRIVEWGHKISFSYITKKGIQNKNLLEKLSFEICNNEQQACSSPQCVFIEDADFNDLKKFGEDLKIALEKISPTISRIAPVGAEMAEITVSKEQIRLRSHLEEAKLIEGHDKSFRIFIDMKNGIEASPLFRTIWLKPMKRNEIQKTLRPLKQYLQTVGLECEREELQDLVDSFFNSGVQRIRSVGEMTDSYVGEPHDGVYALSRFCQKVSYADSGMLSMQASFEPRTVSKNIINAPIMSKEDFQNAVIDKKYSDLFFHSGGSSGEPKLSMFTYDDYYRQMELAADGLFAAGLNPAQDRVMNLFYAGNLYGGFVSFFTILEFMEAVQFPMGASTEFESVANTIIKNKVDTILGMPSYIMQLFSKNESVLKKYKGIKKIFFGGEHMSLAQKNYLKSEFNVEIIRSAAYGSVDAGPLGFQCAFSEGGVHHLHERLHLLEIVDLENDKKVNVGDVGRLLFTSKVRHGQNITRYEIGDVGKIIPGRCECGRSGTRFELLGRHGDVFRIGTIFLSYQKFQKILNDYFEFEGSFQLHLFPGGVGTKEKVELKIESNIKNKTAVDLREFFCEKYFEVHEVVNVDKVLDFEVVLVERENLNFNPTTGKLRSVIDHRK
jgi:phenylacetate-coenzyme A ligase PaaK-like adenylate-forming protein